MEAVDSPTTSLNIKELYSSYRQLCWEAIWQPWDAKLQCFTRSTYWLTHRCLGVSPTDVPWVKASGKASAQTAFQCVLTGSFDVIWSPAVMMPDSEHGMGWSLRMPISILKGFLFHLPNRKMNFGDCLLSVWTELHTKDRYDGHEMIGPWSVEHL